MDILPCLRLQSIYLLIIIYTVKTESCGLVEIPTDTSETNPYTLPPIPDRVLSGEIVWENEFEGNLTKTTGDPSPDFHYLSARRVELERTYLLTTNDLTGSFTRYERRRDITRQINMYCGDGTVTKYFFKIPLEDVTPPAFERGEYTFNINSDWNPKLPITDGQPVIVKDDAFELGTGELSLSFGASPENILKILPVKMWEEGSEQDEYNYRLHLFIDQGLVLRQGYKYEIFIFVEDQFNTGRTKINIIVL